MNLGAVIKQEVQRLARREVGGAVKELRASLKKQRAEIAALKQSIRQLSKARPAGRPRAGAIADGQVTDDKQRRFSPKRLAQLRVKKDLTLGELARLVDISAPTLTKWLNGASRPSAQQLTRIAWIRAQTKRELSDYLAKPVE